MCGRYVLRTPAHLLTELFVDPSTEPDPRLVARYNIAPTQSVPAVRVDPDAGSRALAFLRWGLVPFWAKDLSIGNKLINARVETVAEKPAFRDAVKHRRCLLLADGFYEWRREGKSKIPFLFERDDHAPFACAGLGASRGKGEDRLETCTIVTMPATTTVAAIHDRMPLILPRALHERWLDPTVERPDLEAIVDAAQKTKMCATEVSPWVNNPRHEDARCVVPAADVVHEGERGPRDDEV